MAFLLNPQHFSQHTIDNPWGQSMRFPKENETDEQPTSDSGRGGSEEDEQGISCKFALVIPFG